MCLIVFAWNIVPGIPLFAAGNRDEFYNRPTQGAAWWEDSPQVYAGRDLEAGGTWMGITREGRFAAITNIRAPARARADAPSRGALVADYLRGECSAQDYVGELAASAHRYNGFNLLVGDAKTLIWYTNGPIDDPRNGRPLAPGIYGLSNATLDAPWPKVIRSKAQFSSLLCQGAPDGAYFDMLSDTELAPDVRLPETGIGIEWERLLSSICIASPDYGTRTSTLVRLYDEHPPRLDELLVK